MHNNQYGIASLLLLAPLFLLQSCTPLTSVATSVVDDLQQIDHYVPVVSSAPAMSGEMAQLYVRERLRPEILQSGSLEDRVVLFVHGAGTPAAVAFDVPVARYSWMSALAQAGFDTFALDLTGYGRSTRPHAMNDRCNLSEAQQLELFGNACEPSFAQAATTMASDWDDLEAVVEWLLQLRQVSQVHLVAWSQGGPRALGYAARHPDKVGKVVVLAPAYSPDLPATAAEAPIAGAAMTKQSRDDFVSNWDRQVGCANQYDPVIGDIIWRDMLDSDPVGSTWGTGVRRAPRTPTFGWTPEIVANTRTPALLVAATHDAQVPPARVQALYEALGSTSKLYLEMTCSSHNAMWEADAQQLFDASLQWLRDTRVNGMESGMMVLERE